MVNTMMLRNVLEYLLRSAERCPDQAAFADEMETVSYERMLRRALSLGTAIAARDVAVNRPVALLSDRTAAVLCGFQGVLAAGDYYVPLDAKMPRLRLEGILRRLRPGLLLYGPGERETALAMQALCPILSLDEGFAVPADPAALERRRGRVLDVDPAYVIFTSGSTGEPKGIVVSHRSVLDFTEWMGDFCGLGPEDVFGNQAPFHFDLSVKDIYQTLKWGATCWIAPRKCFVFPLLLLRSLEEHGVTALLWSTSAFHLVANSGALAKCAPQSLRCIALGGEVLQARQLNLWRACLPEVQYINLYGPTEVTVDCTAYRIDRPFADGEPIPIGTACANKEVLLLDRELRPVAPGQIGEICVRGAGLANGYWDDEARTQAAFLQNPLCAPYPDRIYRTGDLGYQGPDGQLYFSTRRDGQIKHQGYRIELGEIEVALAGLSQVDEAVCLYEDSRDRLHCAYVGRGTPDEIARALRLLLPKYMLPNVYHSLETMPRNANGKADRPALRRRLVDGNSQAL